MIDSILQPTGQDPVTLLPNSGSGLDNDTLKIATQSLSNMCESDPSLCPIHQLATLPSEHFDAIFNLLNEQNPNFNPWVANEHNKTTLTHAYEGSLWEPKRDKVITALIIKGSAFTAKPDIFGLLPLHYAALLGLDKALRHLMTIEVDLHQVVKAPETLEGRSTYNFEGCTPLELAIRGQHQKTVDILINEGKCTCSSREVLLARENGIQLPTY